MSQPKYDSIWKALPDIVLLALIRLAVPEIEDTIEPWKTDLKVLIDREADNTYLIFINGMRVLLHLEYQNYLDDTMPLRMFQYVAALKMSYYQHYQEDIPVIGVVIWAKRGKTPPPRYQNGIDAAHSLTYDYHEIHLDQVDWQDVDPILLVLAPFLRGVTRQNAQAVAIQMYEAAPPEYRKLLLGALFNLMARSFKDIDDIEQAILQQVRTTMDELIDAVENGPMAGRIMARAEARGKAEATVKALTIFWKVRFGAVPADVSAALVQADGARLDAMLDAFGGAPTEAEMRAMLGL